MWCCCRSSEHKFENRQSAPQRVHALLNLLRAAAVGESECAVLVLRFGIGSQWKMRCKRPSLKCDASADWIYRSGLAWRSGSGARQWSWRDLRSAKRRSFDKIGADKATARCLSSCRSPCVRHCALAWRRDEMGGGPMAKPSLECRGFLAGRSYLPLGGDRHAKSDSCGSGSILDRLCKYGCRRSSCP